MKPDPKLVCDSTLLDFDFTRGVRTMASQFDTPGTVMVRPLLLKPQWMNGLSERLLVSHYVNNYGGALRRLNARSQMV
jgi:hypothetical protein